MLCMAGHVTGDTEDCDATYLREPVRSQFFSARGLLRGSLREMDLTREQVAFLADLRKGSRSAVPALDASMIGPLIRANLVRWDDDTSDEARQRRPPGSTFTLTALGEQRLAEHDGQQGASRPSSNQPDIGK